MTTSSLHRPYALVAALGLLGACPSEDSGKTETKAAKDDRTPQVQRRQTTGPQPSGTPDTVRFETEDGVTIVGTLRPGGRPDAPAAILVHGLNSTRGEWDPIVERLGEPPGLTTLAIDMRGHGDSTSGRDGESLSWREFDRDDWPKTGEDVTAAVDFIASRDDVDPARIVAAGSSLGSSAVVVAAAKDERIDAVALLSPGRAYRGIDAISPIAELGRRPLLAVAAEGEEHAAKAAQSMARIAKVGSQKLVPGSAHGVAMIEESPDVADRLVAFLRDPEADSGGQSTSSAAPSADTP